MDAKEASEELKLSSLGEWVPNKEAVKVAIEALRVVPILENEMKKQRADARETFKRLEAENVRLTSLLNNANQALKRAGSSVRFHLKADEMPTEATVFEEKEHPEDVYARQYNLEKERLTLKPITFVELFPENMEEAAWVDEDGVVWRRPTAEAYARTCKALRKKEQYVETLNNSVGCLKREQQQLRLAICQQCKCSGNTQVCYDKRSGLACQYWNGLEARATKTTGSDGK